MTNGTKGNWAVVWAGVLGAALSDIVVIGAVGLGLGVLLEMSEIAFSALRWIGAGYLCFLAWQLWHADSDAMLAAKADEPQSLTSAFRQSFLVALTNPKVLMFFVAFLPQFIDESQPLVSQYAALAIISAAIDIVTMLLYATGGAHAARWLGRTGKKMLVRSSAGVMLAMAALVVLSRRSPA